MAEGLVAGEKYHYKGVTIDRLNNDLKEKGGLPIGIRPGSATLREASVRKPTELDMITVWFTLQDDLDTAVSYCDKSTADSVVLKADLQGYNITKFQSSVYLTVPVKWEHIWFQAKPPFGSFNFWLPLANYAGKKLDTQLALIRSQDSSSGSDNDDDF
jgi:hypothetical protein